MAVRKPTLLRWTEEAEANQVLELAELDDGATCPVLASRGPWRRRRGLLPRLRSLLLGQSARIVRDEQS
jgi:hypothetical protein